MASVLVTSMGALSLDAPSSQAPPQNSNTAARTKKPKAKKHNKHRSDSRISQLSQQPGAHSSRVEVSNDVSSPPQQQQQQQQQQHNLPRRRKQNVPVVVEPYTMFAHLHHHVQNLLNESDLTFTFHDIDNEVDMLEARNTNIPGRFRCFNRQCSSGGWFTYAVPITIRYYANDRYNARVYNQRCKKCDSLGKLKPDDIYAERVVYWLKTWSGVPMERIVYLGGPSKGPHEKSLCEGCKAGICVQGQD
jgi:hypothetical protein